jgi:DNA-binding CsgD family transcriptional regulator
MDVSFRDLFCDLLGNVPEIKTRDEGDAFLNHIRTQYGLSHVAYLGLNIASLEGGSYFHNTYSDAWRSHYVTNGFISIDPVVRRGLTSLLPQEWSQLERAHPEGKRVFDEGSAFGIRRQGLTFPIRGLKGETALFNVAADLAERDWAAVKTLCLRELQTLAHYFHHTIMSQHGQEHRDADPLSGPELECLKWAAFGKASWEIATIIGRGERTIKFHLSTARYKLGSVTTTQAVAKAIAAGLVVLDR